VYKTSISSNANREKVSQHDFYTEKLLASICTNAWTRSMQLLWNTIKSKQWCNGSKMTTVFEESIHPALVKKGWLSSTPFE